MDCSLYKFLKIIFLCMFVFSVLLNFYHFRRGIKRRLLSLLPSKNVVMEDEPSAWYSDKRILINHAGVWGGLYRYMNSRESISECMEHECPVIEVDVSFTNDDVPVLTHWFAPNEDIMFIKKPALCEFLEAEYPGNHHPMTFDELMNMISDYKGNIFVDVKMGEERKFVNYLESNFPKELTNKLIFQVHEKKLMKELWKKDIFGYLHYNSDIKTLENLLPDFQKYGVHTVSVNDWDVIDRNSIKKLKQSGIHVYVYTVNSVRRMKTLFDYGADGIFTDSYDKLYEDLL